MSRKARIFRCARCGTRRSVSDPGDIDWPIDCKNCGFNLRGSTWSRTDQ
jgi:transcription elongation factor Elf1